MYYIFICGCEKDNLKFDWSQCKLCMIYYFYSPDILPKIVLLIVPFATSLFILMSSRLFYPKFSNVFIKCLEIFVAHSSKMGWGIKVKWLVLTHLIAPSQCPSKGTQVFFSSFRRCVLYRSKLWVLNNNATSTSFEVDPLGSYLWFYHLKALGLFNLLL
jgi:hypothetical protein